jgi:two-component system, NtrC family, nitrogen regulation response regulator NtrX
MKGTVVGTVLVADDDTTCRDSMKRVLEHEGYMVEGAADVDSALAAIHARTFDLIVCDYRMPGKSGIDLLEQLRAEHSSIPVLMVSACADPTTEALALELGAAELMRKPIRRQRLVERAARLVER